jgi:crotonobetainyl-CoA:carnitine CoA-transferase CaiB-like acyl-CoA transferase
MTTPQPLAGRTVVELSQYIAGPTCGQLLADFGARVVKVEPLSGDPSRAFPGTEHGSVYFRTYNTGKDSQPLDLTDPSGRERLEQLLGAADALVVNFTTATLTRLDLTWEALHTRHPRLVLATLSGFGPGDPRPCMDPVAQAESGFAALNCDADGSPRISAGYPVDHYSGVYAAFAVAMALCDGTRQAGVHVDVSMIDVAAAALAGPALMREAEGGPSVRAAGNRDTTTCPSTVFACRDGHCYIYGGLDKHWARLRQLIGGEDLDWDAAERLANAGSVEARVSDWTAAHTVEQVGEQLSGLGIPCGVVRTPRDAFTQWNRTTGLFDVCDDGQVVPGFPARFDGARLARRPAPDLSTSTAPTAAHSASWTEEHA